MASRCHLGDLAYCSYGTNAVYRHWSDRAPWSYWGQGGQWNSKYYSHAARPTNTVRFHDWGGGWGLHADSPYQLYHTSYTLEYWAGATWMAEHRRHDPERYCPCGTLAFMDGHVQASTDFLQTCTDENYNHDTALALEWWSFTGE